jgi:hypothetical protein
MSNDATISWLKSCEFFRSLIVPLMECVGGITSWFSNGQNKKRNKSNFGKGKKTRNFSYFLGLNEKCGVSVVRKHDIFTSIFVHLFK